MPDMTTPYAYIDSKNKQNYRVNRFMIAFGLYNGTYF